MLYLNVMYVDRKSTLSSSSIDYQLVYNFCEPDTSANRPKVPCVMSHVWYCKRFLYWFCSFIFCAGIADLENREKRLDELIRSATLQLKMLTEDPQNARYPLLFR